MNCICFNGEFVPITQPVLFSSNRGFRYADGLFETMYYQHGHLVLSDFHFERIFSGMNLLQFNIPNNLSPEKLIEDIHRLCIENDCSKRARIRLSIFRGNGNFSDLLSNAEYIIECWKIEDEELEWKEGILIDIYPFAKKSPDILSNFKTANYLSNVMASIFAKEHGLDDCIMLNSLGNIAETTVSNLFLIKENKIITPALSEGCVKGVMRRYLLTVLRAADYEVEECVLLEGDLLNADEIFLTNAIIGLRTVRRFRDKEYRSEESVKIFERFIKTIHF